ncbi:MAG: tRNA pseudouridine(55) synthase TruB [Proteobacteria bacterium]|nr:tRNA pseudouridine(55) synthase TruB [Candidatus Enterousia scatequi]
MNGWIILDKASGLFSRSASSRVARLFGEKKSGHIGTLDPMATGVLPIAIGSATKMIPFIEDLSDGNKEYLFSVQFGFETDTLDITGKIIEQGGDSPSEQDIVRVLPDFIGNIFQTPPQYSSVHVNGIRAYDIVRGGKSANIPPRQITIHKLEFLGIKDKSYNFRVCCTRGTYVRSLGRDIARKLGTFGTVDMIKRVKTNGFDIKNAVKLDFLENLVNNTGALEKYLMPIDFGLGDIPVLNLDNKDAVLYKNGGFIKTASRDGRYRIYNNGVFIGIGDVSDQTLRPVRTI